MLRESMEGLPKVLGTGAWYRLSWVDNCGAKWERQREGAKGVVQDAFKHACLSAFSHKHGEQQSRQAGRAESRWDTYLRRQ